MREFKNIFILFGLLIASCFFVMPIKADTNIRLEAQENESENFTMEEPVPHLSGNQETGKNISCFLIFEIPKIKRRVK